MRIVIDMQGMQGSNQLRGIGRYTLSITKAIILNRGVHEVCLALNGLFPDTIELIRATVEGLLPQENIRVWQSPGPVNNLDEANSWRRGSAELVREAFLASLKPDIILISSLFEGLGDDGVTSIGKLSRTVPTATILYDLIPLIHRSLYLDNPAIETWYENKLDHLRRTDLLLAISESSRQEAIDFLGFPPEACITISAAVDHQFQPQQIDYELDQKIRTRYGLPLQFIMYTGGIDHRKNIEGLIRAYAKLPLLLRQSHQLAIVCAIQPASQKTLLELAKTEGLQPNELVLTGFVANDDLLALYNLSKAFVFPSWHEGFGLPVLEAMSCGRAVIGANTSSVPEVIGRNDALFDPMNEATITEKLKQVLTDDAFRTELEQHGLKQAEKFSWDSSAQIAIAAMEAFHTSRSKHTITKIVTPRRPKMAYVSPLPPARSGISDYSAELLPELTRHYDIDVIIAQDFISDPWVNANCSLRSVEWFETHADYYDRVLYHFGNSEFHKHMFSLLEKIPGVVVLHDFYQSGVVAHMDFTGYKPDFWATTLYQNHGYAAVQQRYHASNIADVIWHYPCNGNVLIDSIHTIVHSEYSKRLATTWYGKDAAKDWTVIPHLRAPSIKPDRIHARRMLNLSQDDFVVCSFGLLGSTKLNHSLVNAWLKSTLGNTATCVLIFVGENCSDNYGAELVTLINQSNCAERIRITGWVEKDIFHQYLAAADMGVQLRTCSRGETSGTVLDCMNYALPIIVNSNGSMADLQDDAFWKLPDEFNTSDLVNALEALMNNASHRIQLGTRARDLILTHHAPRHCAEQYAQVIERAYHTTSILLPALAKALSYLEPAPTDPQSWLTLSQAISHSLPLQFSKRQLLVDISELVHRNAKTGIQRVVCNILQELLTYPPEGFRVEPVYANINHGYCYARRFTFNFLECHDFVMSDDVINFQAGDIFLGLDLQQHIISAQKAFYTQLRNHGVLVQFVVYDLLPITLPKAFTLGTEKVHHDWLTVVTKSDGALCISKSVADELKDWISKNEKTKQRPFKINWFHLAVDLNTSTSSKGIPKNAEVMLETLAQRPTFIMVGTIEPRKGHSQTLAAVEQLWAEGVDLNFVIVGKQGWMMETWVKNLSNHPELNKRLFWLDGISDEYLKKIYETSSCLIAASEGEGFGLPLIEAAQFNLPILARDIPVFREVAGKNALYFTGQHPNAIAEAAKCWLTLYQLKEHPESKRIPWLNWSQSTDQLTRLILE